MKETQPIENNETKSINNNQSPEGQEEWKHLPYEQLTPEQQIEFNKAKDAYYGLLSVLVIRNKNVEPCTEGGYQSIL